ncbi:hypothetical protein DFH09DRAFT_1327290 [Mycena vulgaris]|nr:hypothetical protein DFH09DRAFT_1327290 [Mycena vulgaris]
MKFTSSFVLLALAAITFADPTPGRGAYNREASELEARGRGGYNAPPKARGRGGYNAPPKARGRGGYNAPP